DLGKINISFTNSVKMREWQTLKHLIDRGINAPLTSSMGRFFDAVAAILFSISKVDHEAQAAIKLQGSAERAPREEGTYKYKIKKEDALVIDTREVIKGIVKDIRAREECPKIASRFHNTVAEIVVDVSSRLRRLERTLSVVLSGGVFQNKLLTEKVRAGLIGEGFDVYTHKILPTTDAGISVGQAVIADARRKRCV
ncbi:MAG: carbamoyltransferase HypF, partial [Candidatus Omnitrophota bacterium]